ncbi:hypothetical protein HK097_005799, partial [Rhizophlyctis rosea]
MDANYLKQTIGQTLSSALLSFLSHTPQTLQKTPDPITYIAHYLLNHSHSQTLISQDAQNRKAIQSLIQSVATTTRVE